MSKAIVALPSMPSLHACVYVFACIYVRCACAWSLFYNLVYLKAKACILYIPSLFMNISYHLDRIYTIHMYIYLRIHIYDVILKAIVLIQTYRMQINETCLLHINIDPYLPR